MKYFNEIFIDKTKYGVKIQTGEYGKQGKHIIVDQGQNQIAGYTDREDGLFEEVPVIIFGDHTRVIKYIDQPFFLGADGVKVLRIKDGNTDYKYLYYALKNVKIPNTGYNRHFKWLKESKIEYPDIKEQRKIVRILDKVSDIIQNRKENYHNWMISLEPDLSRCLEIQSQTHMDCPKQLYLSWENLGEECQNTDLEMILDY